MTKYNLETQKKYDADNKKHIRKKLYEEFEITKKANIDDNYYFWVKSKDLPVYKEILDKELLWDYYIVGSFWHGQESEARIFLEVGRY